VDGYLHMRLQRHRTGIYAAHFVHERRRCLRLFFRLRLPAVPIFHRHGCWATLACRAWVLELPVELSCSVYSDATGTDCVGALTLLRYVHPRWTVVRQFPATGVPWSPPDAHFKRPRTDAAVAPNWTGRCWRTTAANYTDTVGGQPVTWQAAAPGDGPGRLNWLLCCAVFHGNQPLLACGPPGVSCWWTLRWLDEFHGKRSGPGTPSTCHAWLA